MYSYRAPLRDIRFVVHEVLDFEQHYRSFGREELNRDLLEGILEEGARVSTPVKQISPFNDYAKGGLKSWQTYLGPTKGFDEMVFNLVPYSDADGNTLAVGAYYESGDMSGAHGDAAFASSGAAYVFSRTGTSWAQQGYIKAANAGAGDFFGIYLSLSGSGDALAVGE